MLYEFVDTASKDDHLLLFTTGSKINTGALRPECIKVSVEVKHYRVFCFDLFV